MFPRRKERGGKAIEISTCETEAVKSGGGVGAEAGQRVAALPRDKNHIKLILYLN